VLPQDGDDRVGRRQRRQRHAAQTRLVGLDETRTGGEGKTDCEAGEAADHPRRVAQVEAEGKAFAARLENSRFAAALVIPTPARRECEDRPGFDGPVQKRAPRRKIDPQAASPWALS
jgi:hypothetical protein